MRVNPLRAYREYKWRTEPTRPPYDEGGIVGECRFPAEMRPDECLWDRDFQCVREDHQHNGDEQSE